MSDRPEDYQQDGETWREYRKRRFEHTMYALPFEELVGQTYFELIRDHCDNPAIQPYEGIPHLLAERLRGDLTGLRTEYVWGKENTTGNIAKTVTLLETDKRTREETAYLLGIIQKLEGAAYAVYNSIPILIQQHQESTGMCSGPGTEHSTTYPLIMELGWKAVPDILRYLQNVGGGVHVLELLHGITHANPYSEKFQKKPGYVANAVEAWLDWGYRNGYLDKLKTI